MLSHLLFMDTQAVSRSLFINCCKPHCNKHLYIFYVFISGHFHFLWIYSQKRECEVSLNKKKKIERKPTVEFPQCCNQVCFIHTAWGTRLLDSRPPNPCFPCSFHFCQSERLKIVVPGSHLCLFHDREHLSSHGLVGCWCLSFWEPQLGALVSWIWVFFSFICRTRL